MDIKVKFGSKIRELRKSANLSQEELANLSEIDRSYMSSIERGRRNVSITTIEKLSIALNISIKDLMEGI